MTSCHFLCPGYFLRTLENTAVFPIIMYNPSNRTFSYVLCADPPPHTPPPAIYERHSSQLAK